MPSFSKTNVLLLWLSTIAPSAAFLPAHHQAVVPQTQTALNMAFDTTQETNIYDGPLALTKERDACGVGFVANPTEGESCKIFPGTIEFYRIEPRMYQQSMHQLMYSIEPLSF